MAGPADDTLPTRSGAAPPDGTKDHWFARLGHFSARRRQPLTLLWLVAALRGVIAAPVLLVIAYLVGFATVLGVSATILAVAMAATATFGYCPLYTPFHFRTDRRDHHAPI